MQSSDIKVLVACEESQAVCKTFPGIAAAMAEQWGDYLLSTSKGD